MTQKPRDLSPSVFLPSPPKAVITGQLHCLNVRNGKERRRSTHKEMVDVSKAAPCPWDSAIYRKSLSGTVSRGLCRFLVRAAFRDKAWRGRDLTPSQWRHGDERNHRGRPGHRPARTAGAAWQSHTSASQASVRLLRAAPHTCDLTRKYSCVSRTSQQHPRQAQASGAQHSTGRVWSHAGPEPGSG